MATIANSGSVSAAAPGGAKAPAASGGGSAGNVAKRLQKELMGLMMSGNKDISAFPSGENILQWAATITGPPGSVYEGKSFKLTIEFTDTYPHDAPKVMFTTPTFHPNVDAAGNICLDILKVRPLHFPHLTQVTQMVVSLCRTNGHPHTTCAPYC